MLGLIEYPPKEYERIVAIATTSEGISRKEIGRHRWANISPMWNMDRDGFRELYSQIPSSKPVLEEVWRLSGGNPKILDELKSCGWDFQRIVKRFAVEKGIPCEFVERWRQQLEMVIEDSDNLWCKGSKELVDQLIEKNLVVYNLYDRDPRLWLDIPPPEKDLKLGIGRYVAWQTPLHREAVREAIKRCSK